MTQSSIILLVDKLHILREWMSSRFGPPLDVVTMCVAWTNVLDITPDPMSTHFKSLDLMSLVLTFGPGWLLRLLISLWGFGWLAFCPGACSMGSCQPPASSVPGGDPMTDPERALMSLQLGWHLDSKWSIIACLI